MGDSNLRSKYDRLRDERESRQRVDQRPESDNWTGETVDVVYETDSTSEADAPHDAIASPSLFKQYENWSNGRLKSIDIIYGEDVKRLAYEIWLLKANRSNARTASMLHAELEGEMPSFPSPQTIRGWRIKEEWDARATDDIAQVAQILNRRHLEKLFALTEEALEVKASILANDHPEKDSKRLDVIARTATELLKLRGIGTAGNQGGADPPKAAPKIVEEAGTIQEKSAALRDEILGEKQQIIGKKKHRK